MASPIRSALDWRTCSAVALLALLLVPPAHALRVVNYNLMYYPNVNVSGRNPYFRTAMSPLGADVVIAQELYSSAGIDSFRLNVLNVLEPGQWSSAPYTAGPESNNMFLYKPAKVAFLGQRAFFVSSDMTRYVNEYRLKPVGYSADAAELRIYSVHLKAGTTDAAQRLREATGLRDTMNNVPPGTHCIITGDFNIYTSTESGFQKFLESQLDNDGRVYDPLNAVGTWQDNAAFASIHTQCPSTTVYRPSASYSGGGLDDRFDLFLPTYNLKDGTGIELLASTYKPVGNDGLHLNLSITDPPILPADTAYARALWYASDHLPIRVDIQLPAKLTTDATLAFGSVIVGALAQSRDLTVSNPAVAPADSLNCTFAAPADFGAPGPLAVAAGGSAVTPVAMSAASAGLKSGNLTISSDAPDSPTTLVGLSGTVLDHAQASLDSLAAVVADTLDFGEHAAGDFTPLLAAVHDRGYDALRARLSVNAAQITGGDGRFSITSFSPVAGRRHGGALGRAVRRHGRHHGPDLRGHARLHERGRAAARRRRAARGALPADRARRGRQRPGGRADAADLHAALCADAEPADLRQHAALRPGAHDPRAPRGLRPFGPPHRAARRPGVHARTLQPALGWSRRDRRRPGLGALLRAADPAGTSAPDRASRGRPLER